MLLFYFSPGYPLQVRAYTQKSHKLMQVHNEGHNRRNVSDAICHRAFFLTMILVYGLHCHAFICMKASLVLYGWPTVCGTNLSYAYDMNWYFGWVL